VSSLNTVTIDQKLGPILTERVITQDQPADKWPAERVSASDDLSDVARTITKALVDDPGYVVIEVPGVDLADDVLISAAWNLFTVLCSPIAQYRAGDLISSVRVNQASRPGVSQYASSHATGGYHTDGTELAQPPEAAALMCVSSADSGGETLLMDSRKMIPRLSAEDRAALSRPLWFHDGRDGSEERRQPVLNGSEVRYLRRYIAEGHRRHEEEPPTAALDAWDRLTALPEMQLPVLLRRGQMLMWDNRRFVHGRLPFVEKESRRWLVRFYGMLR
jgi:alpha-ketoglutarate-dependent taurine dioxygenase